MTGKEAGQEAKKGIKPAAVNNDLGQWMRAIQERGSNQPAGVTMPTMSGGSVYYGSTPTGSQTYSAQSLGMQ